MTCAAPARAEITAVEPPTDANGVYQISTAGHLVFFRNLVNGMDGQTQTSGANAVLLADINIAGEENWTPIGTAPYAGTFDGGGHTISGLQVNRALYVGLFGNIFGGTVKNLTVETAAAEGAESAVSGGDSAGIIVGYLSGGTIENCTVSGSVSVSSSNFGYAYAGGIAGRNYSGTIKNCAASVSVSASSNYGYAYAGGIAGLTAPTAT